MPIKHKVRRGGDNRAALAAATHAIHERLHEHAMFRALLGGTLHRSDYEQLMLRLYGFYMPLDRKIESACGRHAKRIAPFRYAPRAALLASDLVALGVPPHAVADAAGCSGLPAINGPGALVGALYVVEGATLGGSVIARAADRSGLRREGQADYWGWCRRHGAARWAMARPLIERIRGEDVESMVGAARATFSSFAAWLHPLDATPAHGDADVR